MTRKTKKKVRHIRSHLASIMKNNSAWKNALCCQLKLEIFLLNSFAPSVARFCLYIPFAAGQKKNDGFLSDFYHVQDLLFVACLSNASSYKRANKLSVDFRWSHWLSLDWTVQAIIIFFFVQCLCARFSRNHFLFVLCFVIVKARRRILIFRVYFFCRRLRLVRCSAQPVDDDSFFFAALLWPQPYNRQQLTLCFACSIFFRYCAPFFVYSHGDCVLLNSILSRSTQNIQY